MEDEISFSMEGCSAVLYILPLPNNPFILAMFAQALLNKHGAPSCKHFCSSQHTYSWYLSICWIRPLLHNQCQASFNLFQLNISSRLYPQWAVLEIIL